MAKKTTFVVCIHHWETLNNDDLYSPEWCSKCGCLKRFDDAPLLGVITWPAMITSGELKQHFPKEKT